MMLALAALAAFLGFAWLALGMDTHWRQVKGQTRSNQFDRLRLRVAGTGALLASGALCFAANRPSMAVLVWVMLLTVTAPLVAFTLTWRARALRHIWPGRGAGSANGQSAPPATSSNR